MIGIGAWKQRMPARNEILPGRHQAWLPSRPHLALGGSLRAEDFPGMPCIWFGMGCFWGAERKLWNLPGVLTTAAGYAGGYTPNPTYREVCTGMTGHAEVVMTVFDPGRIALGDLLKVFWESHDPTQGMRQGNDVGTQYRSAIFAADPGQLAAAEASARVYQQALAKAGRGSIATEIALAGPFYYAEEEHQQYLQRYPDGYCGLAGTGVACPM